MRTACMVFLAATTIVAAACSNDDDNPPPSPTEPIAAPPPAPAPAPTPAPSPAPTPAPTPTPTPTPPAAPTWTQVYNDVITQRCLPCHASQIGVQIGQLDMSTKDLAFSNLVNHAAAGASCAGNSTPRVVPGNHDGSLMYLKVSLDDPAPCGSKMPFGLPPLSQAQVDEIAKWIDDGAKNN